MCEDNALGSGSDVVIEELIWLRDGFPRIHWRSLIDAVNEAADDESALDLYDGVIQKWSEMLADSLPGRFLVSRTNCCWLISDQPPARVDRLARQTEKWRTVLLGALNGIARDNPFSSLILTWFSDCEVMDAYEAYFFNPPLREEHLWPGSGQFNICGDNLSTEEKSIVIGLVYSLTEHVYGPSWFKVGLAEYSSWELLGPSPFSHEREFSNRPAIDDAFRSSFWNDSLFASDGLKIEYGYIAARKLVAAILESKKDVSVLLDGFSQGDRSADLIARFFDVSVPDLHGAIGL